MDESCYAVATMRAYSLDLRQRVLEALESGQTQPVVAERFSISLSSVQRYARLHREQGHLCCKPSPGKARSISDEQAPELEALVLSRTDWTLESLCEAWQQRTGRRLSTSALHRNLHWRALSHKKSAG